MIWNVKLKNKKKYLNKKYKKYKVSTIFFIYIYKFI